MRAIRRHEAGFTLLEAIVTLVIVALIVAVLMQALQQAIGLRTRLLRHEREARLSSLQEHWFRESVQAAQSDFDDALGPMRGDATQLSFLSAAPLDGSGMARVGWRLQPVEGGFALVYGDGHWEGLQVVEGPLHDPAFAYLDEQGQWVGEWNADSADDGRLAGAAGAAGADGADGARTAGPSTLRPLPLMVRLRASTAGGELLWLVPLPARPRPVMQLRPEELSVGL